MAVAPAGEGAQQARLLNKAPQLFGKPDLSDIADDHFGVRCTALLAEHGAAAPLRIVDL
jgi:hypothetical protein